VRGVVEQQDQEGLARAFAARSAYLRQLAWQNTLELAQRPKEDRAAEWSRFAAEHDAATLEAPSTWTGFVVLPDRLTFWRSDPTGPSHRVEYATTDSGWTEHHLAG
jgi:pyridoxamine 5'-phosphate oxidase